MDEVSKNFQVYYICSTYTRVGMGVCVYIYIYFIHIYIYFNSSGSILEAKQWKIPVWSLLSGSYSRLRRNVRAAHDLGSGQRLLSLSSLPQSHQRRHF